VISTGQGFADGGNPFIAGGGATGHARVEVVGRGPIYVIAAHGWTTDSSVFGPWIEHIDPSRFTFAFVDARGYGAALGEAGAFTVAEYGEDLLAVGTDLGWDAFSLVGHSMGGMAIQYALAAAPERVKSLVGIAPVAASGSPMQEDAIALFRDAVTSVESRRVLFDFSTGNRLDSTWLDEQVAASMASADPVACRNYLDSWTTQDISDRVTGREAPVLVVVGEHDPVMTADFAKQAWGSVYPNLSISVAANAGHYPTVEAPAASAATVVGFLLANG